MCRTGPDGALWVADMYRFVIEHPKWIPDDFLQHLEVRAGADKGRIYRIYREDAPPRPIARLDQLDTAGLVAALDSPNGPQRDLAHQVLVWRADKAAAEPLTKIALHADRPQVRLQALCTLDGLDAVTDDLLRQVLSDPHPALRRHGVRLTEPRLAHSAALATAVVALAGDDDPHVRQQVAYSLGFWNDPQAAAALARLLIDDDPYIRAAAMTSLHNDNVGPALAGALAAESGRQPQLVEQLLTVAAALGNDAAVREALDTILQPREKVELWQLAALGGFLDVLERRKVELATLVGGDARDSLAAVLDEARELAAGEGEIPEAMRLAAIRLIGRGLDRRDEDAALLASLLSPQHPASVQSAAVAALARRRRPDMAASLLAGWRAHTPGLRQQILDVLLARDDTSAALLAAIESGQVAASQLDARRRGQLLQKPNEALRQRAERLLAGAVDPDRQKLVETYLAAADGHSTDASRGKEVFAKRCANCHKLDGVGHSLGPDLAALTDRSPKALYTAMLDPNRAVEDKFLEYVVLDVDGVQHNGMLLEENRREPDARRARGQADRDSAEPGRTADVQRQVADAGGDRERRDARRDGRSGGVPAPEQAAAQAARGESPRGRAAVYGRLDPPSGHQLPGVRPDDQDGGNVPGAGLVEQPRGSRRLVVRSARRQRRGISRQPRLLVRRRIGRQHARAGSRRPVARRQSRHERRLGQVPRLEPGHRQAPRWRGRAARPQPGAN
jgi:putative heme-binding domain-containing protein